jgi:hypothetical protein
MSLTLGIKMPYPQSAMVNASGKIAPTSDSME